MRLQLGISQYVSGCSCALQDILSSDLRQWTILHIVIRGCSLTGLQESSLLWRGDKGWYFNHAAFLLLVLNVNMFQISWFKHYMKSFLHLINSQQIACCDKHSINAVTTFWNDFARDFNCMYYQQNCFMLVEIISLRFISMGSIDNNS